MANQIFPHHCDFSHTFVYLGIGLFLLLCFPGCHIKGANDPFSYTPKTSHTVWIPPAKAEKRLPLSEVYRELEDYVEFTKESPLTLAEIIDIALFYNPSTKLSWANARVSAAEYGQSLKEQFIQAEIDGNYSRMRAVASGFQGLSITSQGLNPEIQRLLPGFTGFSLGRMPPQPFYQTKYGGQLQLTYLILDFGQSRTTSEAALQSLYNADWSHNSQIQMTIQTLMNNYYNYLYQKQLLYASKQDVLNAKVSLNATEERFQQGLSDISDIVQAKTNYLQQKLNVVSQKQILHNAYTQLVNDMGLPSNQSIFFQDYPEEIEMFDLEHLDQLILKANRNRPDLLAAEASVKSSELSFKAARLKHFPTVNGEFDIGREYYRYSGADHFNDGYNFNGSISLNYPLFQGFFIENTIKKAKASLEASRANLYQIQLSIIQEVSNYKSDVSFARESIEYSQAFLDAATEDFKVNLSKYKVGTGTIVELINAQTAVANARAQLAKAKNSWYTSLANLAYATGILIPPKTQDIYEKAAD